MTFKTLRKAILAILIGHLIVGAVAGTIVAIYGICAGEMGALLFGVLLALGGWFMAYITLDMEVMNRFFGD